ncbi:MAG TPA: fibronectin type III domain-containing protein, partial [Candidatus Thermoplasmatota archaeon]|nr:fibronectin type III domain-containing protein [Candidatus Thermoplasmatota archaeon]
RYALTAVLHNDGKIYMAGGRDSGANSDGFPHIIEFTPGVTPPTAPRSFQVSATPSSVTLTWVAPLYDGGGALSSYQVLRETPDGATKTFTVSASALSYVDRDVAPGRDYTYTVRAVNPAGQGATVAPVTVKTEITVPGAITQFEVAGGDGEAVLRWSAPASDGGSPITGYEIVRTELGKPTPIPARAASETTYLDTGLENGRQYNYTIRALNAKGAGPVSAPVSIVPRPVPGAPEQVRAEAMTNGIEISWQAPSGAALPKAFRVYRYIDGSDVVDQMREVPGDTPGDEGRFAYGDVSAAAGVPYVYQVSARNDLGEGPKSAPVKAALLVKPAAPRAPLALAKDGAVHVRWEPLTPEEMGGATSVSYAIERREGTTGAWEPVANVPGTAWKDSKENVTVGKSYQYGIMAVNAKARSDRALTEAVKVVAPKPNEAPKAVLTLLRTLVQVGEDVPFDGSYSLDPDGEASDRLEYFFDFGDGTNSGWTKSSSVSHRYAENRSTLVVSLKVRDARGAESELQKAQITVGRPAVDTSTGSGPSIPVNPSAGGQPETGGAGFVPVPAWVALVALGVAAVGFRALAARRSR